MDWRDFSASEGILWATDYQGLLCMFEYMMEAHCLGSSLGRALGLSGSVLLRLRESSTWGGAWRASCMKSSYAFSPGNPSLANSSTSQGKQMVLATI